MFKNLFDDDERGVSPVIGVILMVAITVILAAVIASFVLGFGDSVQQNAQAGVSISQSPDGSGAYTVSVTVTSIQNADTIEYRVYDNSGDGADDGTGSFTELGSSGVGDSVTIGSTDALETDDKVVIRATGSDGSTNVIREYTVK